MSLFHQRECRGCGQPCDGYYCDSCTCIWCGMTLFNGICDNCIYGNGKPIICTACGSMVKGGLCLTCDFREKNLYNCDPNAYSFDNSNYLPRPQYENYLCKLCGNNSHDGYDCQQQFPFVHEQKLSYNQNYNVSTDNLSNRFFRFRPNSNPTKLVRSRSEVWKIRCLSWLKFVKKKEFLCIHDDVDDLIESALDSKLLLIHSNSQRLDKKEQEVKPEQPAERGNRNIQSLQNFRVVHKSSISLNTSQISSIHAITPILSTKEPEHLLSMRYEHLSITPETKSDEVIESNAENLLPIPSKCEVTLEDKRECDLPISKNSPIYDHFDTFHDSKIDDDISVYDDDFEDIEYVEAPLPDLEIVSVEEQEEEEERLINLMKNDITDDSSNEPLLEEVDLFLSDNSIPPGIENVADDPEGDIRDEILVVMNDKDEDVYYSFIFVIFDKVFSLLSAESEDTIFDPGISD
nr:hypothetical protein [Tanacetum cinerariifolium]